jgi:hypothetical protein
MKSNLRPRDVEALSGPFEALSRGSARLQQCLAATMEAERLASFQRLCTAGCNRAALSETFAARARELLANADKL